MSGIRGIRETFPSQPTLEGAGVRLKRAFGYQQVPKLDPFLLLDDFHSDSPEDYIKGFPWHPHRGIETVTYMLNGQVEHGDSMGNTGLIGSGDIQWMSAGSGIIHQEMPKKQDDYLWGFQLWVNLPAHEKMTKPRYQDIHSQSIPEFKSEDGINVKVIAGHYKDLFGPVRDIICEPEYLDVTLPAHVEFKHSIPENHTAFIYTIEGEGNFSPKTQSIVGKEHIVLFDQGRELIINSRDNPIQFLLISGKPINEPVAWYGPIVMNTEEELQQAFDEYRQGTFIKDSNT
ncbi:pirin family protein [Acidobacteriota bacterium]